MQAHLEKISVTANESFRIHYPDHPYFYTPWHFHPEMEIMLILESNGTRFVGESIKAFHAGDLVMIGKNLPHYWKNDTVYYKKTSTRRAKAIVIHFMDDFMGRDFMRLPEMKNIVKLFERAAQGISYKGKSRMEITKKILSLNKQKGARRISNFILLLDEMASSKHFDLLSPRDYEKKFNTTDIERINRVYDYVMKNFQRTIPLKEIAQIASMSATAFCRYFKNRTNKTFSEFLTEIRIGYACRQLIKNNIKISQLCYDSGFGNLSNFNKKFKKITGYTPMEYRKWHD